MCPENGSCGLNRLLANPERKGRQIGSLHNEPGVASGGARNRIDSCPNSPDQLPACRGPIPMPTHFVDSQTTTLLRKPPRPANIYVVQQHGMLTRWLHPTIRASPPISAVP
jgi:hypothetical protein